jgi:hypothetical protein
VRRGPPSIARSAAPGSTACSTIRRTPPERSSRIGGRTTRGSSTCRRSAVSCRHRRAITAPQRSQRHLFQRPDTDRLDATRTSLIGAGASWSFGRTGDTKHWRYGTGGQTTTPGLELNDAGFQRLSDLTIPWVWGQYHDEQPSENILGWQTTAKAVLITTSEPRITDVNVDGSAGVQLVNQWSIGFGAGYYKGIWDRGALRGGAALHVDPGYAAHFDVSSDARKRVQVSMSFGGSRRPATDSGDFFVGPGITIQARSNIDVFVGTSWNRRDDAMQYVAEGADEMGLPHYVFARINQTTVAMTTRVNWTFSPKLSLQGYARRSSRPGATPSSGRRASRRAALRGSVRADRRQCAVADGQRLHRSHRRHVPVQPARF